MTRLVVLRYVFAGLICAAAAGAAADSADATSPDSLRTLLGQSVPDVAFSTADGQERSLAPLASGEGVVLVFPTPGSDSSGLAALDAAAAGGAEAAKVPAYVVLPKPSERMSGRMLVDDDGTARGALGLAEFSASQSEHILLFINPDRVIRRVESRSPGESISLIFSRVRQWRKGEHVYRLYCARCHGPDGADTTYPDIKRLDGIGAELDEQGIIDNTRATAFVNIDALPQDEREALAVFVASLPAQD